MTSSATALGNCSLRCPTAGIPARAWVALPRASLPASAAATRCSSATAATTCRTRMDRCGAYPCRCSSTAKGRSRRSTPASPRASSFCGRLRHLSADAERPTTCSMIRQCRRGSRTPWLSPVDACWRSATASKESMHDRGGQRQGCRLRDLASRSVISRCTTTARRCVRRRASFPPKKKSTKKILYSFRLKAEAACGFRL